ncbi:MAG: hypothetical protein GX621_10495 [Pirellulaceae bacterium]|nr:hypothetical protein [Pirellulaceae bacterium]
MEQERIEELEASPSSKPAARRSKSTDARVVDVALYFLPVHTRVPLKFGTETLTSVTCARACVTVEDRLGRRAVGWGETPLSVQWVWPSALPYGDRHDALRRFCLAMARRWSEFREFGHPLEIGHRFQQEVLDEELGRYRASVPSGREIPLLAGLLCCAPFDVALHDAYGNLHDRSAWATLDREYLNHDLSHFITPDVGADVDFGGRYPSDYLILPPARSLFAWHLVGGLDPIGEDELVGDEPDDGHPVLLTDWIRRDGLKCLKVKLRGNDAAWDYDRLVRVGRVGEPLGADCLTADFNCTVTDPAYVVDILDRLRRDEPRVHDNILYIEQPFPYDLEEHQIDVHEVSRRKLLLMDESAHNWELVRLGRTLGWTGVALKTCKTLTGAILSLCWARAHGMKLMVQDLTNPMLAQIPHLELAAHCETLMGVETNSMQYYPDASREEAEVHPGLYRRVHGCVDLSSIKGAGFGYRIGEIGRVLPEAAWGSAAIARNVDP